MASFLIICFVVFIYLISEHSILVSATNIRNNSSFYKENILQYIIDINSQHISYKSKHFGTILEDKKIVNIPLDNTLSFLNDNLEIPASSCLSCNQIKLQISENELTKLRIEFVKNQILRKLKLKEKPKVSISALTRPLVEGITMQSGRNKYVTDEDRAYEDYYAKTTQRIIFPKDKVICKSSQPNDDLMETWFVFAVTNEEDVDITMAELYFTNPKYDEKKKYLFEKDLFIISEVKYCNENILSVLEVKEFLDGGRVKVDILKQVNQWAHNNNNNEHIIKITCKTCLKNKSNYNGYMPYIVIDTNPKRHRRRHKRHVDCSASVKDCCREKLYISFRDIGWDDWIIHPQGYDAYFCRGSCTSAASITLSGSHHNTVISKILLQKKSRSLELIPCCTSTRFSSLDLFYMNEKDEAVQKILPNMVVEECGCM